MASNVAMWASGIYSANKENGHAVTKAGIHINSSCPRPFSRTGTNCYRTEESSIRPQTSPSSRATNPAQQYPWHTNRAISARPPTRNQRDNRNKVPPQLNATRGRQSSKSNGQWRGFLWRLDTESHTPDSGDGRLADPPGMNGGELPPIVRRPGSATSRRSSRDSAKDLPLGTILKYERPLLITASPGGNEQLNKAPRTPRRSAGSESSNANSSLASNSNSETKQLPFQYSKSWCSNEQVGGGIPPSGGALETLFEKNGVKRDPEARTSTLRTRRTSESQEKLSQAMRNKSLTSLSKLSDSTKNCMSGSADRKCSSTNVGKSDQNFSGGNASVNGRTPAPRVANNRKRIPSLHRQSTQVNLSPSKPMRTSKSTPNLGASGMKSEHLNQNSVDSVGGEESDSQVGLRIREWLESIDSSEVERPESPIIDEEVPLQTDTAIHIVYEGD